MRYQAVLEHLNEICCKYMAQNWQQIVLAIDKTLVNDLEKALFSLGCLSVTIEDAGDEPIFEPAPGETPVWEQLLVTGLFDADAELNHIANELQSSLGKLSVIKQVTLEDRVWEREWMSHFNPMKFGQRLWICPSWCNPPEPGAINLMLDPGLAFGTGTHETTALCLEWLDQQDLDAKRVIDYGCGSGVLAIAALLLGCKSVLAVDNDPQALQATRQNGVANNIGNEQLQVALPEAFDPEPANLLMANILAGPLIELAPRLASLVLSGGQIILSGILKTQIEDVSAAYRPFFDLDAAVVRGDWVRLSGNRKP
jgi:ribosomal protein L11 methyltransferase